MHNGNYVKHGSKCILRCYLLDVFMSPRQNEKGEYIKPYLRPMSSMTKEELKEFQKLRDIIPLDWLPFAHDWLLAHHFDYRGLIEKGLALEAPKGMYNIKWK